MPSEPSPSRSWNLIDLGAGAAVLLAVVGVVWSPKLNGIVARATGSLQPLTVMVDVRGAPAADSTALMAAAQKEGKVAIVIRNQPHGTVPIRRIIPLERRLTILSPDGRTVSAADPNQKTFGTFDARFVLEGQGRRSGGGALLGGQAIKIGTPVELEGSTFRFGGTVTNLLPGSAS